MNNAHLPYSLETFVDREAETDLVEGLTRQILQGETNRPRVLMFQGDRGSGKSWLSLHLARTVLPAIPGVTPLLIGLYAVPEELQPTKNEYFIDVSPEVIDADMAARSILDWVTRRLNTAMAQDALPSELATRPARNIEKGFSAQALVLILDSILEADWNFLTKLETYLLTPLVMLPRVLIVMTGRGRPYSWKSPYLRVDVESKQLGPFDETTVQYQLERQHISLNLSPKKIHELGGGYPLANFLLAQNSNTSQAMDRAVRVLLSVVQPAHRSERVRQYFEALSVLDGFREEEMFHMFAAYFGPDSGEWTLSRVRETRDECMRTHLMRWENSQFVIDTSLRLILRNFLKMQRPNTKWRLLEKQAYQMYAAWAKQYPKSQAYYSAKAQMHSDALADLLQVQHNEDVRKAFDAARNRVDTTQRVKMLLHLLLSDMPVDLRNEAASEALASTRDITDQFTRAHTLLDLIAHLPRSKQNDVEREILATIRSIGSRGKVWLDRLPDEQQFIDMQSESQVSLDLKLDSEVNRHGGVDVNSDTTTIGGDIVGRDKITYINQHSAAALAVKQIEQQRRIEAKFPMQPVVNKIESLYV